MFSRGVLVHCPSRLGAAVAVQAAEMPCGDRVFTKSACEHAKAAHQPDGVMSHNFNCRLSSLGNSELKTTARQE
jgi:3-oxoacyl-ACP reductase-like protein